MDAPLFDIEVTERDEDGVHVVVLRGELDLAGTAVVQERLTEALATGAPVRLDLSAVSFIDSSGVRLLLEVTQTAERDDRAFALTRVPEAVTRVLTLAGVVDRLPYTDADGPGA